MNLTIVLSKFLDKNFIVTTSLSSWDNKNTMVTMVIWIFMYDTL